MLEKLKQKLREVAEKTAAATKETIENIEHLKITEEERNARYDICKSCEHFNTVTTQCKICHCVMSVKTYLAPSSCPLKKWTAIEKK